MSRGPACRQRGILTAVDPPVGRRSLLASSEWALLDRLMDFGSRGQADGRSEA